MTAHDDPRSLLGARVRFRSSNDVVEGTVTSVSPHLVAVRGDDGRRWIVDRYTIRAVGDGA